MLLIVFLSLLLCSTLWCADTSAKSDLPTSNRPSDQLQAFIDLQTFKTVQKDSDKAGLDAQKSKMIAMYSDYQAKYAVDKFAEEYGRRFAVYIASVLVYWEPNWSTYQATRWFVEIVRQKDPSIDGNMYMLFVKTLSDCLPDSGLSFPHLMSTSLFFFIDLFTRQGADMIAFHRAAMPDIDSITSFSMSEAHKVALKSAVSMVEMSIDKTPEAVERLCALAEVTGDVRDKVMSALDRNSAQYRLDLLFPRDSQIMPPTKYEELCALASKLDGPIVWHQIIGDALKPVLDAYLARHADDLHRMSDAIELLKSLIEKANQH